MDISKIVCGKNPPQEVNVIIEIPSSAHPVKYEINKDSGALLVDRVLQVSMVYPCNYGFIPNTLSSDGDPCDVLVIIDVPLIAGSVISVRPIGVLFMEDEAGADEKILAVPIEKVHAYYANVKSYKDLPKVLLDKIIHFFEYYKTLEPNKWVKVKGWGDVQQAHESINEAVLRYES